MNRAIHIKTKSKGYIPNYKTIDEMGDNLFYSFVADNGIKTNVTPTSVLVLIEGGLVDE